MTYLSSRQKPSIPTSVIAGAVAVCLITTVAAVASAHPRVLPVRPALQHTLPGSAPAPIVRNTDIREAEMAFARQSDQTNETETAHAADHTANALGQILEQTTRAPQRGVILVAKPGFDALKLLWDLNARRINSRIFADRIAWLGYADPQGSFVVPEVPRGVSMHGVVVAAQFRPAPFVMHVRSSDAETIKITPVYLSR